jgi:putative pyruvate formate lyase activating enzyme
MMSPYKSCLLCPRRCGADREAGQHGYCGETSALRIAFAGIHRGEEPPINGAGGSGTIFVSGCNLGCAFCQNYQISKPAAGKSALGKPVDSDEFAEICLSLQGKGAENINIVTGSHAAPAIAAGVEKARKQGLSIPVLWNSSGYDAMETLAILKGIADVYLPDLKTLDKEIAARFFNAPDYPECAMEAIQKMIEYRALHYRQGNNSTQTIVSGVMVRHLVIPGFLENTRQVLAWFAEKCNGRALLSIMTQYTPIQAAPLMATASMAPDAFLSEAEYKTVLSMLEEFKIDDGFCQELITGSDWLPDFTRHNPFSSELSVPVWP